MTEVIDPRLQALTEVASQLGLTLPAGTEDRLLRYLSLLARWNATYNLTAVRDPAEMLTQHLADCLAAIGPLRRVLAPLTAPRVLDVGSGGGLPGAVIAIVCPEWQVVCVDTVGKKAAFIRQLALELQLPNLLAEHARVEKLAPPGRFDLVTSRAFAALADFTRLTRYHLADGGVWMAMKGKFPAEEVASMPGDVDVFHVEQIEVPGLAAERCLVWMRRRPA